MFVSEGEYKRWENAGVPHLVLRVCIVCKVGMSQGLLCTDAPVRVHRKKLVQHVNGKWIGSLEECCKVLLWVDRQ